ncbi:hypothetical protein BDY21DRAFT_335106 [Lineolata rhizophorae]|uniref:Uncharacterized protein n=1 Tax=Lineolata rhizophorae TaxID=578093 RepID=A0A6A6P8Z5_9PEZI|nr:hypothetical protein BDY21DRAFT_335106 [Lineolata rhizophorae]
MLFWRLFLLCCLRVLGPIGKGGEDERIGSDSVSSLLVWLFVWAHCPFCFLFPLTVMVAGELAGWPADLSASKRGRSWPGHFLFPALAVKPRPPLNRWDRAGNE